MNEETSLTERFEANRSRLRGVAYRMLGSLTDADDAVQQAWLHLSRSGAGGVDNLNGWLTTVVARICLDMLRSRRSRAEEPLGDETDGATSPPGHGAADPEQETALADSVGLALLVVLETLTPAERLAFVLHEMFDLPFDEIAPIVGRTPAAARQLASRARRRVQGHGAVSDVERANQRRLVEAYLVAVRTGDLQTLLSILAPDVVLRADAAVVPPGGPTELRGAQTIAGQALAGARRAPFARLALVNGAVGIVVAPRGRLKLALCFTVAGPGPSIVGIDVVGDPERLRGLELATLS